MSADFSVANHGTIYILTPLNQIAQEWIEDNLPDDAQHWGQGIAVEHRYIQDIVEGIQCDGLTVE